MNDISLNDFYGRKIVDYNDNNFDLSGLDELNLEIKILNLKKVISVEKQL